MRAVRQTQHTRRGFTLVENLVALGVFAIITAGVLSAVGYGFSVVNSARENQRATQILLEKAELVRLYNWDQVTSAGFIPATFSAWYDPKAPAGQRGVSYEGTLQITNFPSAASYSTNMRMLTISLNWRSGRVDRERTYHTYIAKDGVQNYVY